MGDRDELCGRTVGEFVLRERIGEGGFGAVYLSDQPLLGREAVVKVLHQRLRDHDVVRKRFLREAQLASRLDHPYAAHVYAFGVEADDGLCWIAMEMVHGTALDGWLRDRGPLPLDQLVPLLEQVAQVVQTAHDQGIVHRDLKPSNIMVIERAGRLLPKLLDFGIAKLLDEEPAVPRSTPHATDLLAVTPPDTIASDATPVAPSRLGQALTQTNAALGSPPYMSPEQWSDPGRAGPRSDLYSLAVIAFEALTGRRPYIAPTIAAFAELHRAAEIPALGDGFSPALDRFMARALAKRPEDRPASALELAAELRAAAGLDAARAIDPRARSRRLALGLAAGLAVAAGAVAFAVIDRSHSAAEPAPVVIATAAPDAAPAPRPEPAPVVPARSTTPVQIESTPVGADIYRLPSETKVGITPWSGELEVGDGAAVFVVKKRGYADGRVEVDLRTGGRSRVALVRASAQPAIRARRKGDPVDPFKGKP